MCVRWQLFWKLFDSQFVFRYIHLPPQTISSPFDHWVIQPREHLVTLTIDQPFQLPARLIPFYVLARPTGNFAAGQGDRTSYPRNVRCKSFVNTQFSQIINKMARQDGGLERRFASRTKFHGRNDLSSLLSKIIFLVLRRMFIAMLLSMR